MTQRGLRLTLVAGFWALFGLISGIQVWISMITHGHSIPRLLTYYVLLWEGWFLSTLAIALLVRHFPLFPFRLRAWLVHGLASLVNAIFHTFYWLVLMLAMRPYDRMTATLSELNVRQMIAMRMPVDVAFYFIVLGLAMAADFYRRYRERELQAAQLEASLADARLHALELQLRPHFLFNTLNAVSSLVRTRRSDEAVTMISGLSDLLRYTLDHAGEQQVALENEVEVVRRYLEIQHVRFPDRMRYSIDLAPDAARAAVPVLLLQPLAENAVRHGIARSASAGSVDVRAYREGRHLRLEIFNTGSLGDDGAGEEGSGIGLSNTRERLRHLFGDAAEFRLDAVDEGVLASVSLPWSELR